MVPSCSSKITPRASPAIREPAATIVLVLLLLLSSNGCQRAVRASSRGGRLLSSLQHAPHADTLSAAPYTLRRLQRDAGSAALLMALNPLFHWRPRPHSGGATHYHEPLLHELEDNPSDCAVALSSRVCDGHA